MKDLEVCFYIFSSENFPEDISVECLCVHLGAHLQSLNAYFVPQKTPKQLVLSLAACLSIGCMKSSVNSWAALSI